MGSTNHEFYLGDEAAQMAHDGEMGGMAGMNHDEAQGIGLMPGETKTLEYTFAAPGAYQAGCHVNGHYAAGMKATIALVAWRARRQSAQPSPLFMLLAARKRGGSL